VIRLGVIGTGPIAARHLDVLEACEDASVAAICGRGAAARQALATRYRISNQVEDFRDLLRDDRLDAVLVLVAPEAIAAVAGAALETGRPTFLEKPPGLSVAEASGLAGLAARRNVLTMVGLNRRFYSSITAARSTIAAAGALQGLRVEAPEDLARARAAGRTETLLSRWIYANGLHAIDLLRHVGGAIRSGHVVHGVGRTPDTASIVASFELEHGAVGEYVAHWGSPGPWNLTMYGGEVTVVLSPFERASAMNRSREITDLPIADVDRRFKPGFFGQMRAFIDMVHAGRPAPSPAADLVEALASMRLAAWLTGDEAQPQ
jgi:predicted dehydrogenase